MSELDQDGHVSKVAEVAAVYFLLIALGCAVVYLVRPLFSRCNSFTTPLSVLWFLVGLISSTAVLLQNDHNISIFVTSFENYVIHVNAGIVYLILLPPLLYEGAMGTDGMKFRLLIWFSFILATIGVIFTALVLGLGLRLITKITWAEAFLFGSILSSTDPVAVISVLKEMHCPQKLMSMFEGESLLNDGTSVILFQLIALWSKDTGDISAGNVIFKLIYLIVGSPILGILTGVLASAACRFFSGLATIKSLWLIICNSAAFWLGDEILSVSGPLVSVMYGLTIKYWGFRSLEPKDLEIHHHLLKNFAVLSEMLIFELSGAIVALLIFEQDHAAPSRIILDAFYTFLMLLAVRGCLLLLLKPILSMKAISPFQLSKKESLLLWAGGLRGAITLALTLMVEQDLEFSQSFRKTAPLILAATVGFNLVIQGQLFGALYLWLNPYPTTDWEVNHTARQFNNLDQGFENLLYHRYRLGGLPLVPEVNEEDTLLDTSTAVDLLISEAKSPKSNKGADVHIRSHYVSVDGSIKSKNDRQFSYCLNQVTYGAALRQWLPLYEEYLKRRDTDLQGMLLNVFELIPKFSDFKVTTKGLKYQPASTLRLRDLLDEWIDESFVEPSPQPWKTASVKVKNADRFSEEFPTPCITQDTDMGQIDYNGTEVQLLQAPIIRAPPLPRPLTEDGLYETSSNRIDEEEIDSVQRINDTNNIIEANASSPSIHPPRRQVQVNNKIYSHSTFSFMRNGVAFIRNSVMNSPSGSAPGSNKSQQPSPHDVILNLIRLVSEDYVKRFQSGSLNQRAYRTLHDAAESMACIYENLGEAKSHYLESCCSMAVHWNRLREKLALRSNKFLIDKAIGFYKSHPNVALRMYLTRLCMSDLEIVLTYIDSMERIIFSSGSELLTLIGDNTVNETYGQTIQEGKIYLVEMLNIYGEIYHSCSYVWMCRLVLDEKIRFISEKRRQGLLLEQYYRPILNVLDALRDDLRTFRDWKRRIREVESSSS